ncbi:MAG: hypothetical protein JW781_07280 [Deltaproteobacteria bacterium]|nr:hypothetical protein [Candidatus Anaeroferrophillacea bacterium]
MNIIDSSCWLEYFIGSYPGELLTKPIEDVNSSIVPAITLYEVFKKLLIENDADRIPRKRQYLPAELTDLRQPQNKFYEP